MLSRNTKRNYSYNTARNEIQGESSTTYLFCIVVHYNHDADIKRLLLGLLLGSLVGVSRHSLCSKCQRMKGDGDTEGECG